MIGLITYHSAYNFGSMLQAYATQQAVEKLGYAVEIINYRTASQKEYYGLYHFNQGVKRLLKDVLMLPRHLDRKTAKNKFEDFIHLYMHTTKEFSEPEAFPEYAKYYETIISGSDQIWNKHSFELNRVSWKYMYPYLLKGYDGRKVSFASSIGAMSEQELKAIIDDLKLFHSISVREKPSDIKLGRLLEKEIPVVLDPTFLLSKEQWINNLKLQSVSEPPYLLYYSLKSYGESDERKSSILEFARKYGLNIKCVTPKCNYSFRTSRHVAIQYHHEYGPLEFLQALYNAQSVLTDSYHGTILAINFGKDVYSYCGAGSADFRKTYILEKLGLGDRIVSAKQNLIPISQNAIDYESVHLLLKVLREDSYRYLQERCL